MIFISVGTIHYPFDRLLKKVQSDLLGKSEKVIIQSGYSDCIRSAQNIIVTPFFSFEQMIQNYQKARLNISAGGEGSAILLSYFSKNTFILVPRLKKYGEHIDDQQLDVASYFQQKQLAHLVTDVTLLKNFYSSESAAKKTNQIKKRKEVVESDSPLIRDLSNVVKRWSK